MENEQEMVIETAEKEAENRLAGNRPAAVHPKNYADLFPTYSPSTGIEESDLRNLAYSDPFEAIRKTFAELFSSCEDVALIYNLRLGRDDNYPAIALIYARGYLSREDVHKYFTANAVNNRVKSLQEKVDRASAEIFIDYCLPLIRSMRTDVTRARSYLEKWKDYAYDKLRAVEKFIEKNNEEIERGENPEIRANQNITAGTLKSYFQGGLDGFEALYQLRPPDFDIINYAVKNKNEGLKESYSHGYYAGYFAFGNHPVDTEEFYWPPHFRFLNKAYGFPENAVYGGSMGM